MGDPVATAPGTAPATASTSSITRRSGGSGCRCARAPPAAGLGITTAAIAALSEDLGPGFGIEPLLLLVLTLLTLLSLLGRLLGLLVLIIAVCQRQIGHAAPCRVPLGQHRLAREDYGRCFEGLRQRRFGLLRQILQRHPIVRLFTIRQLESRVHKFTSLDSRDVRRLPELSVGLGMLRSALSLAEGRRRRFWSRRFGGSLVSLRLPIVVVPCVWELRLSSHADGIGSTLRNRYRL